MRNYTKAKIRKDNLVTQQITDEKNLRFCQMTDFSTELLGNQPLEK